MLAEIKSEMKAEAVGCELDFLVEQLEAFQERLQSERAVSLVNNPTTSESKENTQVTNQTEPEINYVVNFGWEQIINGPLVPFIRRGAENFVADHIVTQLVYKPMERYFSQELLSSMEITTVKMSKGEADTFNEINITHCNSKVVGAHLFKTGEFMINLDHVRKTVEFYNACKKLLIYKLKENNLFGFIQVGGKNQVPFVWESEQKLVPLFYFEGQSEYLNRRSKNLTDSFKIGYVKFCCKVQKIRKDHYERSPLKVVNIEEVKKLFPLETTFETELPNSVNQDFLAPEVRVAFLHSTEERIQTPITTDLEENQLYESLINKTLDHIVPSLPNQQGITENSKVERGNNRESIHTKTLGKKEKLKPIRHTKKKPTVSLQKRSTQFSSGIETKRFTSMSAPEATETFQPGTILQEHDSTNYISMLKYLSRQPYNVQTTKQQNNIHDAQPGGMKKSIPPNYHTYNKDPSHSSIVTPFARTNQGTESQTDNYQTANVPYESPRSASSPGYPQSGPSINEAVHQVPSYLPSNYELEKSMQPATIPYQSGRSKQQVTAHNASIFNQQAVNLYRRQDTANNRIQQPSEATNIYQHYPNLQQLEQHNSINIPSGIYEPNYYQKIITQNTTFTQSYHQRTVAQLTPSQHTQIEFCPEYQEQQFQQRRQGPKNFQQYNCAMWNTNSNQNFQNPSLVPCGYQTTPGPYYPQYCNSTAVSQNHVQTCYSTTSRVPLVSCQTGDENNNETRDFHSKVVEHSLYVVPNSEFYANQRVPRKR